MLLTENDVRRIISRALTSRDRALIEILYVGGLTSAEAAQLRGCDVGAGRGVGVLTVFGRERAVRVPARLLRELPAADGDALVFGVGDRRVRQIVKAAGKRAGLPDVAPADLRVAHAAHALDRGCPVPIVQRTLGLRPARATPRLKAVPHDSSALYLRP